MRILSILIILMSTTYTLCSTQNKEATICSLTIEESEYDTNGDIIAHALMQTVKERTKRLDKPYNCKSGFAYLILILLANANDINPNPGPTHNDSTIFPCGTCDQPVTWDNRAIRCDTCDQWYHIGCQDVHSKTYSYLVSDEHVAIRWDCMICDNSNYHSLCYGSTAIQTSNSFILLDELMNTSGEQNIPNPVHSSTPRQNEITTRK